MPSQRRRGSVKKDARTEQLCFDYYENEDFTHNLNLYFASTVFVEIVKVDLSAEKTIHLDILHRELMALKVELFGLAWCEHQSEQHLSERIEQSQWESALCTEIAVTRVCLANSGDIWSAAGFYNDTIMQAAIAQRNAIDWSTPLMARGLFTKEHYWEKRGLNSFDDDKHLKRAEEAIRANFEALLSDKECATRLANRIRSVGAWRDGIMIPQKLSSAFAQRLGFSPNTEALLLLQRVTVGLFDNARSFIDAVNEYGSWALAMKAIDDLEQDMIRVAQEEIAKQSQSSAPATPDQ